jgi:manganese transport protein
MLFTNPTLTTIMQPSLAESFRSVPIPAVSKTSGLIRRIFAFFGPGFLVAVGYMDPGNWATSIAGGSKFGYTLLSVILLSNFMAMLFQAAAVRLGIGSGMDLAQACRAHCSPPVNLFLWIGCEIAIAACNLAEVIGMAIGLNLLFGIPLFIGVCLTVADVALILALQAKGFRYIEALIVALIGLIGACFGLELMWLSPDIARIIPSFVPHKEIVTNPQMLYLAVGIIGATVMPHNLYLHSSVVQTRRFDSSIVAKREAIRYATWDSCIALGLALFVNAGILILAAGSFFDHGKHDVADIAEAFHLLSPTLGVGIASAIFGLALLSSGLSSSVTGTLAGQIVMEGFLNIRLPPHIRRLLTRAIAIVPAMFAVGWYGSEGANAMLIFSQVVLSMQLPFAIIPLLLFTTRKDFLGELAFSKSMACLLWISACIVISLNVWVLQKMIF